MLDRIRNGTTTENDAKILERYMERTSTISLIKFCVLKLFPLVAVTFILLDWLF
jgi:hypothetical protein